MSVIRNFLAPLLLITLFFGCGKSEHVTNSDDGRIYGSGKIVSEKRNIQQCSGIKVLNYGEVYLTQDSVQSIRIEADNNIIGDVVTEEQDGILQVGLGQGSFTNITLKIYVSLKSIGNLTINGAGTIKTLNQVESDTLRCSIIGAGNIYLNGAGDYLKCEIDGAGKIDAENYHSKKCKAVVSGAGSCIVYAYKELDAAVNGVGTIYYYGNPSYVISQISGLGQIVRK
jgi:hypothetical protein